MSGNEARLAAASNNNTVVCSPRVPRRKGDGIDASVEGDTEEELDYEYSDDDEMEPEDIQSSQHEMSEGNGSDPEVSVNKNSVFDGEVTDADLLNNPKLKHFFDMYLDERIKKVNKQGETSRSTLLSQLSPQSERRTGNVNINKGVKSSDTMVYVPALARKADNSSG